MTKNPIATLAVLLLSVGFANAQQPPAALPPLTAAPAVQFQSTATPLAPLTGRENCTLQHVDDLKPATANDLIAITLPPPEPGNSVSNLRGKVVVFGVDDDRVRFYRTATKIGYCRNNAAIDYFTTSNDRGEVVVAVARAAGQLHIRTMFGGLQSDIYVDGATVTAVAMPYDKVVRR